MGLDGTAFASRGVSAFHGHYNSGRRDESRQDRHWSDGRYNSGRKDWSNGRYNGGRKDWSDGRCNSE
jgi:hypothetical protein